MEPDGPASRVERTLWTFWCYITEAVNRFLRPQPADLVSNEPNSFQGAAVDSEPPDCGEAEGSTSAGKVDEEQPFATASLLSSSRPAVAWELCTTEIDLKPAEESVQYKTRLSKGSESKECEDGESTREELSSQTGNDGAGLLVAEDARAKEDKQEKSEIRKDQMPESDELEQHVNSGLPNLTDDAISEDMKKSGGKVGAEVETVSTVAADDHEKTDKTTTKIEGKDEDNEIHHEDEDLDTEDNEVKLCTVTDSSPEEDNVQGEVQRDDAVTVATQEKAGDCEGALQLASANENKSDGETKEAENQILVCEELSYMSEGELIVVGQEHMITHRSESAVTEEENIDEASNNHTINEVPEWKKSIGTVTEDIQQENILVKSVTCSEEAAQNATTRLHTDEFTDKEEDVEAVDMQTNSSETDVTIRDISADTFVDEDQVKEESLSSEADYKESYMEIVCTTSSVTVNPKGETEQEISRELENISPGMREGQVVVSQELNTPTCEETQEGVPEYNNELGPDENTTQRFLEVHVRYCEETRTTQLPEEVESEEQESLQNSGCSTAAGCLLVREPMEEKQESTEDIKNSFGLVVEKHTGLPQETEEPLVEAVIQESRHLREEHEGRLLERSMKTEITHLEKEFETHVGLADETVKTSEELQDGTDELLVDVRLCNSKEADTAGDGCDLKRALAADEAVEFADETLKFLEAEVKKMTETSFFQESVLAVTSEQNNSRTSLEDIIESEFLKRSVEIEPKLPVDDSTIDAEIDVEETGNGNGDEEGEAQGDVQNKHEMELLHLKVAGTAAELITERKEKENTVIAESQQTINQSPDRALEISEKEITDSEAADESKTTESKAKQLPVMSTKETAHVTQSEGSYTEETSSSISAHQDVIDEDIIDLRIETAMSEDTDGIKQQGRPEPGQQVDTRIDPSNEEQGEISSEKELMDLNSGESGLVSGTEISSSTVESGFLVQSLSECGSHNSETQLLKSTSTGSLQGVHDMLASMSESADIFEFSAQQSNFESQDVVMKETTTDSEDASQEASHLNQKCDESQEETYEERVELAETGSQKETDVAGLVGKTDWKDTEEADVASLTTMSALFQVGKSKVEDEPPEVNVSDSSDEIRLTESGQSRTDSEASLEEEITLTEPDSQGDTLIESEELSSLLDEPQAGWSGDVAESSSGPNRAEVAEEPTSEDQDEVEAPLLDFTVQRSRIAVKNPRVRPPKNPRSLLHMPSVDPTPSSHAPLRVPAGVPLGGLGIGIKLPGLGAGFPVLKKTQQVMREDNSQETLSQETEMKPEEEETKDSPKQDKAQHKPKWMPPGHPGFGNPLMSELKTKLKKTTKE